MAAPAARPAAAPRAPIRAPDRLTWSWVENFLKRELQPYPGRVSIVARMTIAATLAMLAIMTFHIPGGALGGYFALVITRENLRSTALQSVTNALAFVLGTSYALVGVIFFVDSPVTHFFWVIGSLYMIFFVMGTARNYSAAAGFSFLIATAIPLWDRAGPVELKTYATLWTLLSVLLGLGSVLLVEVAYRSFHPRDSVVTGLVERLRSTEAALRTYAQGRPFGGPVQSKLLQYAMIGPASLRRAIIRNGQTPQMRSQLAALISLTGRLVDLTVSLEAPRRPGARRPGRVALTPEEAGRLLAVADALAAEAALIDRLERFEQAAGLRTQAWHGPGTTAPNLPLLPLLEQTVTMLRAIFSPLTEETRATMLLKLKDPEQPTGFFVRDSFTNRDHLVFALRGCLAASLCYLAYNLLDWPGINTAVATCIITALGTIGSSRQKQLLRIGGAIAGGFLIALPAQIYLLPLMDSITAFTLYFAAVSALAAWFATSSPRLSYFGLQIALAFYLVNLQEPFEQISLAVARDRVVGVLLGLIAMWVVFDQLWAPLASVRMQTLLAQILGSIGEIARAVAALDRAAAGEADGAMLHLRSLRERVNGSFSQMNSESDGIQFEVGGERERKLRAREQMLAMQPAMRTIFLLELALGQHRAASEPFPGASATRSSAAGSAARDSFQFATAELLADAARRAENSNRQQVSAAKLRAVEAALERLRREEPDDQVALTLCGQITESLRFLCTAQQAEFGDQPPRRDSQDTLHARDAAHSRTAASSAS